MLLKLFALLPSSVLRTPSPASGRRKGNVQAALITIVSSVIEVKLSLLCGGLAALGGQLQQPIEHGLLCGQQVGLRYGEVVAAV